MVGPVSTGTLEAIWLKRAKGGPMDAVAEACLEAGRGLVGNADQGGKRHVTLIEAEAWEAALRELDASVPPTARRANLMLRGLVLPREPSGLRRVLRIGEVRLRILNRTSPCERMDAAFPGLQSALRPDWRCGVYGEVLAGGSIRAGDAVGWE